jgi:hypothetical protein
MVRRPPAPFDAVDSHHRLATPSSIASQVSTSSSITNDAIPNHHYGRGNLSRVPRSSPSAKNRALGEDNLLEEELHSGKMAFPECLALGEDRHSGKAIFPERNTWGRLAHEKEKLHLTATIDGAV